jgi:hypothetical protein
MAGKARASRNAFKGAIRPQLRQMRRILGEQQEFVESLASAWR